MEDFKFYWTLYLFIFFIIALPVVVAIFQWMQEPPSIKCMIG